MSGTLSHTTAVSHTLHDKSVDYQRRSVPMVQQKQQHTGSTASTVHQHVPHQYPHHQRHHDHHQHYQMPQQQFPQTPVHKTHTPVCDMPLLPPHIHSMLYHSIVNHTTDSPMAGCQGIKKVSVGFPTAPTGCLQSGNHTHEQRCHHHHQQQQQQLSDTPAAKRIKPSYTSISNAIVAGTTSTTTNNNNTTTCAASRAAGVLPLDSSQMAPSPYSEDASLGNISGSPFTTRGLQTTDKKTYLYTSPAAFSPGVSPSKVSSYSPSALTGRSLEKELQFASSDELIQILLELSSCNMEAAQFIQSKARLFALRHTATPKISTAKDFNDKEMTRAAFPDLVETAGRKSQQDGSLDMLGRFAASSCVTPRKPLDFEDETPKREICSKFASAPRASLPNYHPCNQSRLLTPLKQRLGWLCMVNEKDTSNMERSVIAEKRPFCAELHPCLRWYKSCRHPAECFFAGCPQNLCLNWVRGCCVMGDQCFGVHRLPEACSIEVRTVFELSHGADRDMMGWMKQQAVVPVKHADWNHNVTSTPRGQIITDPVSIPASLEHHHRPLPQSREEIPLVSDGRHDNDSTCNCRSCRLSDHECESGSDSGEQHLQFSRPPPAQPVSRSLDDSFAGVESPALLISETPNAQWWTAPLCSSLTGRAAICEEDVVEFPPRNALTRTQSPVEP